MSENKNTTPLEDAKRSFEEIQKFAQEQAQGALNEQVANTLKKLFEEKLNEDTTINIDGSGNVSISTDGEMVDGDLGSSTETGNLDTDLDDKTTIGDDDVSSDDEDFIVSDDEDEIAVDENTDNFDYEKDGVKYGKDYLPEPPSEIHIPIEQTIQNQNMEEMNRMMEDDALAAPVDAAPAPAAPDAAAAPVAPAATAPAETAPAMPELLGKLDALINIMMQQQGAAPAADANVGAEAGTDQDFEVVDDEASAAPAVPGAPAQAPAAMPAEAPAMEEEIEITDYDDKSFIDEMENDLLDIEGLPGEETTVDETRGVGFTSKRTGDKTLKMGVMTKDNGHHSPATAINETKINKAHYESKIDELIKENASLKKELGSLQETRSQFEEAFVELRTEFDKMALFNGKMALVNKVLMNGGLTTEEKINVCEQFDSTRDMTEAHNLFRTIMKENNIKSNDNSKKIKSATTNTARPKSTSEALYESADAKRAKVLAGISKSEEELD